MDVLDAPEGELSTSRIRGKPVDQAVSVGEVLKVYLYILTY